MYSASAFTSFGAAILPFRHSIESVRQIPTRAARHATPRRVREEMTSIAERLNIKGRILARSKLAVQEKFAEDVATEIMHFLDGITLG